MFWRPYVFKLCSLNVDQWHMASDILVDIGSGYTRNNADWLTMDTFLSTNSVKSWWRHQMKTFSALLALCAGNSPNIGEFPSQRPVTQNFDVFFRCARTNGWVNSRDAGDLRRHRTHYDVTVMLRKFSCRKCTWKCLQCIELNALNMWFPNLLRSTNEFSTSDGQWCHCILTSPFLPHVFYLTRHVVVSKKRSTYALFVAQRPPVFRSKTCRIMI